jgi:hypothetical protein
LLSGVISWADFSLQKINQRISAQKQKMLTWPYKTHKADAPTCSLDIDHPLNAKHLYRSNIPKYLNKSFTLT